MSSTTIVTPSDTILVKPLTMSKDQHKKISKLRTILVHKVQLLPRHLNQLEAVDLWDPLTHLPKTKQLPTKGNHSLVNHRHLRKYLQ